MAYEVWKGAGWKAWSVYKNGKYSKFMGSAETAVKSMGSASIAGLSKVSASTGGEANH